MISEIAIQRNSFVKTIEDIFQDISGITIGEKIRSVDPDKLGTTKMVVLDVHPDSYQAVLERFKAFLFVDCLDSKQNVSNHRIITLDTESLLQIEEAYQARLLQERLSTSILNAMGMTEQGTALAVSNEVAILLPSDQNGRYSFYIPQEIFFDPSIKLLARKVLDRVLPSVWIGTSDSDGIMAILLTEEQAAFLAQALNERHCGRANGSSSYLGF